ncbi:hypothetical protein [Primorskyibacter sp. S187A]|uniref:hypothetical protein n=1 Tax=Primorskyibacter sp. S187A TaxID=3415130 RepID=UPI003C7B4D42
MLRYLALFAMLSAPVAAEMSLVMVEQNGCVWCERWDEEIAPIYPKTDVGAEAPLSRLDISEANAQPDVFSGRVSFTPTFVLLRDGVEVDRLQGYPGEDFFWPVLEQMVERAARSEEQG